MILGKFTGYVYVQMEYFQLFKVVFAFYYILIQEEFKGIKEEESN